MKISHMIVIGMVAALLLAACQPTPSPQPTTAVSGQEPQEAATPVAPDPTETVTPTSESAQNLPRGVAAEFMTDFSIASVSFDEILSGGPPKDGIPPIDFPQFIEVETADTWLKAVEPVILVEINGEAKAYPLQVLMWHEIVNDTLGGVPVVVTFCPLCNTAIAFERTLEGEVYDFGTTGRLRYSNLIMYDRQTETWWQQAVGDAIIGSLTGKRLTFVPAAIVSWDEFKNAYPDGMVLSTDTGFNRAYGQNPYVGYDDVNQPPFLYRGPTTPDQLPAVARVLTVEVGEEAVAYPYDVLSEMYVINDQVGGEEIAAFWVPGTASALDAPIIAAGADVGAAATYHRTLDEMVLTFQYDGSQIVDEQTGSTWDVLGRAVAGELQGEQLEPVVSVNHFWFSWAAFRPETRIYQPEDAVE